MSAVIPPSAEGSGPASGPPEAASVPAVASAGAAMEVGGPPREPPASGDAPPSPGAQVSPFGLPLADLVGLRFSVVHLRLAGYALLGVWANEIVGLLTSPLLLAVGTRLHYISQALDVSPLLLVGIALVAYQGELQRSLPERLLLPLLLGLMPVLSAIHFLMAPASIANAMTLSAKQEQVSKAQLQTIDGQFDRATQLLVTSQNLEELRQRLDAIPGVRLSPAPDANLERVRREVRESLLNERRRLRSRIGTNSAQASNQFVRRSIQNASLGVLVGLMLAWMRFGAMREMNLSATYLAWVVVARARPPTCAASRICSPSSRPASPPPTWGCWSAFSAAAAAAMAASASSNPRRSRTRSPWRKPPGRAAWSGSRSSPWSGGARPACSAAV